MQFFGERQDLPRIMTERTMEIEVPPACLFKLNRDNFCLCEFQETATMIMLSLSSQTVCSIPKMTCES